MLQRVLGNAHARIADGEHRIVLLTAKMHRQRSAGQVVFDAVFHQVEDDLIQVVFQNQDGGVLVQLQAEGHTRPAGVRPKHLRHPLHRGRHIDDLALLGLGGFGSGEGEKLGGHAVQAVGLVADVRYKFLHRVHVHVVLQNGIGEQLDGGEGRFQLVGGVGDKLTALALRGLQPLRQVVEFLPQHGQLVAAAHVHLVGIIPLPDHAHGGHDPVQTTGKGVGKGDGKGESYV